MPTHIASKNREPLSGLVERVTFHNLDTGFCVLRVNVRGHRELVTVLGSAASIQPGESFRPAAGGTTTESTACSSGRPSSRWFLTQMYARFSLRQVGHRSGKTLRMCSCSIRSGAVVCRSVDGRLRGPFSWWGPARRQPDQTQAADSMSLTWRRTVKASRTRPRLSPTFYAGAEPSLTVQPLGTGSPITIPLSAVAGLSGSLQLLSRYGRCSSAT